MRSTIENTLSIRKAEKTLRGGKSKRYVVIMHMSHAMQCYIWKQVFFVSRYQSLSGNAPVCKIFCSVVGLVRWTRSTRMNTANGLALSDRLKSLPTQVSGHARYLSFAILSLIEQRTKIRLRYRILHGYGRVRQ